jgi:hypothetical protein
MASTSSSSDRSGFAAWWRRVDDAYIKVWFGGRQASQQARSSRSLSLTELSGSGGGSVADYTELGLLRSDHNGDLVLVHPNGHSDTTGMISAIADSQALAADENSDSDDEPSGH